MALPIRNRLAKKKDFDIVFKEGNAVKGTFLFIKQKNNNLPVFRFGFVIPLKVVGNVVNRNKIKRLFTEAIQAQKEKIRKGLDVVVVVKKKEKEEILRDELFQLLGVKL